MSGPAAGGSARARRVALVSPRPPGWVAALLGPGAARRVRKSRDGTEVEVASSGSFALLRARQAGAAALDEPAFEQAALRVYRALREIERESAWHALRVWNYVPAIRGAARCAGSRYELFNAGRHAAWLGADRGAGAALRLPAASAVDPHGEDLVVEVLAGRSPGLAVENPRQVPAYRYSPRYGRRPPCFARATRLARDPFGSGGRLALVAGTASVLGEDTRHPGALEAQLEETFANLAVLSAALFPADAEPDAPQEVALSCYRTLRAYVEREADADAVAARIATRFTGLDALEIAVADLCRPDLRVEIEGTAVGGR